jgi:hypothetical protein
MNDDSPEGKHATGLRYFRRPVAIVCLLAAVAGIATVIPDMQSHIGSIKKPLAERVRRNSPATPISRLAAIRQESDPMVREERITEMLGCLELARIPSGLADLRHLDADDLTDEFSLRLLRRWAEGDAAAAAAWARSLPAGDWRAEALKQVALAWSGQDLNKAVGWARSLPDGSERESGLLAIAHEAVRSDPMTALQIAADLPTGGSSDELIRRAAMEWASEDAEAAAAWARQIEDAALREQVLSGVALAWGDRDPMAAAIFILNELPSGRPQADTLIGIVQRWAQQDPTQAIAWVESFPESTLRRDALANLAQQGFWPAEPEPLNYSLTE